MIKVMDNYDVYFLVCTQKLASPLLSLDSSLLVSAEKMGINPRTTSKRIDAILNQL